MNTSLLTLGIDVLEFSGIAWPNEGMWAPEAQIPPKNKSGKGFKDAEDTHTHSPTRYEGRPATEGLAMWALRHLQQSPPSPQPPPPRMALWQPTRDPRLSAVQDPFVSDPFVPFMHSSSGAKSSLDDISMPDYAPSASSSSHVKSSITGNSYEHSKHPSVVTETELHQASDAIPPAARARFQLAQHAATNLKDNNTPRATTTRSSIPPILVEREVSGGSDSTKSTTDEDMGPSRARTKGAKKKDAGYVDNKENETSSASPEDVNIAPHQAKPATAAAAAAARASAGGGGHTRRKTRSRRAKPSGSILGDLAMEEFTNVSGDEIPLGLSAKAGSEEDHQEDDA